MEKEKEEEEEKAGPCRPCTNSAAALCAKPTWCTLCKKAENEFPLSRCIECDGAYLRVYDCRNRLGPHGRKDWDNMPLAKKNSFVKKAHGLRGYCLLIKMYAVVRQEIQTELDLVGTTSLAKMLGFICGENAISFSCPICGVDMYANMEIRQLGDNAE